MKFRSKPRASRASCRRCAVAGALLLGPACWPGRRAREQVAPNDAAPERGRHRVTHAILGCEGAPGRVEEGLAAASSRSRFASSASPSIPRRASVASQFRTRRPRPTKIRARASAAMRPERPRIGCGESVAVSERNRSDGHGRPLRPRMARAVRRETKAEQGRGRPERRLVESPFLGLSPERSTSVTVGSYPERRRFPGRSAERCRKARCSSEVGRSAAGSLAAATAGTLDGHRQRIAISRPPPPPLPPPPSAPE
jgi:hypothetical protein